MISSNSFSACWNSSGDIRSFASSTNSLKESTSLSIEDFDLGEAFGMTS